jgi:hypothetical protein
VRTLKALAVSGAAVLLLAAAAKSVPAALNNLHNPPDKIATAAVVDDHGIIVGGVQKVEFGPNGEPTNVEFVLLNTEQIIALDASNFSYDQRRNVLIARLDKRQIARMPSFLAREGLVI